MTKAVELAQVASTGVSEAFKNRIINGAMVIDQRNSGASINSTAGSTVRPVDRFFIDNFNSGTVACVRSTTAPAGFSNSLSLTVSSPDTPAAGDYLLLSQQIEGFNAADLNWGTSNAQTITLSFWIRSSVTGTYGAGIRGGSPFQSYPFSYSISAANTWEYKTVTIPGPTSGTFDTTSGTAFQIMFDLGSGTDFSGTPNTWQSGSDWRVSSSLSWVSNSGATLFITGVQIEVGSSATNFETRAYGQELLLCQRYYQAWYPAEQELIYNEANGASSKFWQLYMPVPMRTAPTATYSAGMIGGAVVGLPGTISALSLTSSSVNRASTRVTMSTNGGSANLIYHCDTIGGGDFVGLSAEL